MSLINKRIKSLSTVVVVGGVSSCSNSPTIKHKHYRLPLVAILIIALMLTSSFLVFFSNKLFTSPTTNTQPNIPPITTPYSTPELLWKTQAPGGHGVYPVVLNGVVYANHDYNIKGNILTAINATDGDIIWQKWGPYTSDTPAYDVNNIIYVRRFDLLMAWNAKDGTKIWDYDVGYMASPVAVNGVVYAVGGDAVVALKATDGTKIWNKTLGRIDALTSIAVNGIVYVSVNSVHMVYALDTLDGKLLWEYATDGGDAYSWMHPSPAVADGIVYVADEHNLYALNAKTGEKMWIYKTGGEVGSLVVEYGVVYVGSGDKKVYALNAKTGEKIWTYNIGPDRMPVPHVPTPAVTDGIVYVTNNYINDSGYINGNLFAFNAANGKQLWSYQIEEMISSLVIVDNKIYITSPDNMYAFSTIQPLKTP